MYYQKLDMEELLRLSIDAIAGNRQADALVLLKTALEREPEHVHATYLLAALHAQLGLVDRAETDFRKVVAAAPDLAIARFQYAQLLMGQGRAEGRDRCWRRCWPRCWPRSTRWGRMPALSMPRPTSA